MVDDKKLDTDFIRESVKMDFAQLSSMIIKDLNATSSGQSLTRTYTSSDVSRFLGNPQRYSKELGAMSTALYNASPHYKRLIDYYANMPTLDYVVEPYGLDLAKNFNEKSFRTGYQRALDLTDLLSIKHEFRKALKSAWIRDTYFGYEYMAKDSYFLKELPFEFCQVSSIEDGVYNVGFNFQYFDRNPAQLEFYPKEFTSMYNKFKSGSEGQWQELDTGKTVVIKINEDVTYDLPPFVGVFKSIYDIENYKALKLAKETMSNYKFVVQKIPIRDKSERNNDFLIDLNNVSMFHNKTSATLPDGIGLITTPFEVDTINFSKDKSETDNVQEAERDFYSSAGTSQLLFNGDKSSNANLGKSITVDEQQVFTLLRQVERVINRKMKREVKGAYKFRLNFLNTTENNRSDVIENYLKSAQYGLPVKLLLGASLGLSPSAMTNMAFLENTILDLTNMLIPLSSSHTQSGDDSQDSTDEGGRPPKNEDELSDKGEEQIERGDNENRE
jgi:hypothetical protein